MVDRCDECGSLYLKAKSNMVALCPECSHILYGYKNCEHKFLLGRRRKCLWNGKRSAYMEKLLGQGDSKP